MRHLGGFAVAAALAGLRASRVVVIDAGSEIVPDQEVLVIDDRPLALALPTPRKAHAQTREAARHLRQMERLEAKKAKP